MSFRTKIDARRLKRIANAKGILSPATLYRKTNISYPTARKIWNCDGEYEVNTPTLNALIAVLGSDIVVQERVIVMLG